MAAKISFPNRACPKCGKAIHIRAKEHDCGWKATATAPAGSKAAPAKTAPAKTAPSNGKAISKMEAVRRVLASSGKDTMPLEIQGLLKKQFGIKMDPTVISTYKSSIIRKGTGKKKMGRPKGSKTAAVHSPVKPSGSAITIADIQAVKELAERLGAEKLRQLAEVLA